MTTLNSHIVASGLISHWGGECINHPDKDVPYGISPSTGSENIYSHDDGFATSGYMYINNLSEGENVYYKEVIVNIFERESEDAFRTYQTAIDLHHYLKLRKYDVTISLNKNVKCPHCYFGTLTIMLKTYPTC